MDSSRENLHAHSIAKFHIIFGILNNMQRIATRIFIYASIAFGVLGLLQVVTMPENDNEMTDLNRFIMRALMACVFIILPSFALSVAGKYLKK